MRSSLTPGSPGVMDYLRQLEQPGANAKPMAGYCVHVDGEAELVSFFYKLDHPSMTGELLEVGDGQDWRAIQGFEHGGQALPLVPSDEGNLAVQHVLGTVDPPRQHRVSVYRLASEALLQCVLERREPQHTKRYGSWGGSSGIIGPLDKSREAGYESRFHAHFERLRLRPGKDR